MDYAFEPPTPELPDDRVAQQALHVNLARLFPEQDFWDRACSMYLEELIEQLRARHGNVCAGKLLMAILDSEPPAWLNPKLFGLVSHEAYRRVYLFSLAYVRVLDAVA